MVEIEHVIGEIFRLQDSELKSRIESRMLRSVQKQDNSGEIQELIAKNGLIAEFNCDENFNLCAALEQLVGSGFFSREDIGRIIHSGNPLHGVSQEVLGRQYSGNPFQAFYDWESRGTIPFDPEDRGIRYLYLPLEGGVVFRFKVNYNNPLNGTRNKRQISSGEEIEQRIKNYIGSVWLSVVPMIDITCHTFPSEGQFGYLRLPPGQPPQRREFMLEYDKSLLIPYFDARLLFIQGHQIVHSLEIGYFGHEKRYVDRCIDLLYCMVTGKELSAQGPSASISR